jgi:hypothetical protein
MQEIIAYRPGSAVRLSLEHPLQAVTDVEIKCAATDAGARVLPHLISAPENARWMHVARRTSQASTCLADSPLRSPACA